MRCSGRTTRIVDEAIQTLFTTGEVKAEDHYDSLNANRMVFRLIMDRLRHEHGLDVNVGLKIDYPKLTIVLTKPQNKPL